MDVVKLLKAKTSTESGRDDWMTMDHGDEFH
jgi:hypothetical protein